MRKAYSYVWAVLDEDDLTKLGWRMFHGNEREFEKLISKLLKLLKIDANLSWQMFDGSVEEFDELIDDLLREESLGADGYVRLAREHSDGGMQEAYIDNLLKYGVVRDEYREVDGQFRFANDYYDGDAYRAFKEISSALDEERFAEFGWQSVSERAGEL